MAPEILLLCSQRTCHCTLYRIESTLLHGAYLKSIFILSSQLRLDILQGIFPSDFPHACYMYLP